MKKQYRKLMRWRPLTSDNRGWIYKGRTETVEVMTTAGNYAMVRFKGCMPFVVALKQLTPENES